MGHVDDAHDAESDGKADGGEQQDRPKRDAVPDVLGDAPQRERAFHRGDAGKRCRPHLPVAGARGSVEDRQRVCPAACGDDLDGGDLLVVGEIGLQHRRRARLHHHLGDGGVGFFRYGRVEELDRIRVAALEDFLRGGEAYRWIGAHQSERADGGGDGTSETIVYADALQFAGGRLASGLAGDGVSQRKAGAGLGGDEHRAVGLPRVERAIAERFKGGHGRNVAIGDDGENLLLGFGVTLAGEAVDRLAQVGGVGRKDGQENEKESRDGSAHTPCRNARRCPDCGNPGNPLPAPAAEPSFAGAGQARDRAHDGLAQCPARDDYRHPVSHLVHGKDGRPAARPPQWHRVCYSPIPPHLPVATLKLPHDSGARQSAIRSLESGR